MIARRKLLVEQLSHLAAEHIIDCYGYPSRFGKAELDAGFRVEWVRVGATDGERGKLDRTRVRRWFIRFKR